MPLCPRPSSLLFFCAAALLLTRPGLSAVQSSNSEQAKLQQALQGAGANRGELEAALAACEASERSDLVFLIRNMPQQDLRSLDSAFLLNNLREAARARAAVPWGKDLPSTVYRNAVLPYAQVNEQREAWRSDFRARFLPLIADCATPGEAALRLNRLVFNEFGVRYSTRRNKPDQSPSESIDIGMASCTGLSILLADACRACAVPARLAGTANWFDKRGNHTWVEVWNDGSWHFLGAAEPDDRGLNHGWFAGDAARALPGSREHGIYAAHWERTGASLPMVWAPAVDWVPAVEVTQRYLAAPEPQTEANAEGPAPATAATAAPTTELLLVVYDGVDGPRVPARLRLRDPLSREILFEGVTRGEENDANDYLTFAVARAAAVLIEIEHQGSTTSLTHSCADAARETVAVHLESTPPSGEIDAVRRAAAAWFGASQGERDATEFAKSLDQLVAAQEDAARAAVWQAYRSAPLHQATRVDFEAQQVQHGGHLSPYTLKQVGEQPAGGWPLFIAMHGGGGVPKQVNDSQWEVMQRYYKDHPEAGGYLYLALRAPNDSWNGFYTGYVYPLIERLVRQFLLYGEVDADKVFLMGYSHGGYGAFAIGPKIPYRFAAIHASAAAPTGGETTARTLRNTRFTYMVGENDTAYGRESRCQAFAKEIEELRGGRDDIYPVELEWQAGHGHGGLPDRDKIPTMIGAQRDAAPTELSWQLSGGPVRDFYWLQVAQAGSNQIIEARCSGSAVVLNSEGMEQVTLCLDQRLVDPSAPLSLLVNQEVRQIELRPSLRTLCESMLERGDPRLAYTMRAHVALR